jgi:hypothetical protein
MALERKNFTTPPGRLVAGSLYRPNDKDAEGRPLVVKNGPNTGQPRVEYFIALAIAKGQERHWAETPWGQNIWISGHQFLGHAGQLGDGFAWKVKDGDSQIPSKGKDKKRPCDREGYPGHWVLHMSGGFQPGIHTLLGLPQGSDPQQLVQADAINPGDYVQVNLDVVGNNATQQPGVFLNPLMVCLLGYGKRIQTSSGPSAAQAGFGGTPLPAGAMSTPPGGFNPAPQQPAIPGPQYQPPLPPGAPGAPIAPAHSAPPAYPAAPSYPPALPAGLGAAPPQPQYAGAPAMVGPLPPQPQYAPPGAPGAAPGYTPPPQYAAAAALPPGPGSYPPPNGTMTYPSNPGLPPANPAFLQPPAPPAQRVMTAKAQGAPYEAFTGQGWTDAMLIQQGFMQP